MQSFGGPFHSKITYPTLVRVLFKAFFIPYRITFHAQMFFKNHVQITPKFQCLHKEIYRIVGAERIGFV